MASLKAAFDNVQDNEEAAVPFELLAEPEANKFLVDIINRVAKSPTGKKSLEAAAKAGYAIDILNMPGSMGGCNPQEKVIYLNPVFSDSVLVTALAHESRHADQFDRNIIPDFENDSVKSQIMLTRAMEADAQRIACVTGWELSQQGDDLPYKDFADTERFVVKPFELAISKGADVDTASTEAFKGWYDNNGTKKAYESIYINQQFDGFKSQGIDRAMKFENEISGKEIADRVCFKEDGTSYFKDNPKILENDKFVDIDMATKGYLRRFMMNRETADNAWQELPIRTAGAKPNNQQITQTLAARRGR